MSIGGPAVAIHTTRLAADRSSSSHDLSASKLLPPRPLVTELKDVSILRIIIYERVPHEHEPTYATQLISFRVRHLYGDGTSLAASLNVVIFFRRNGFRRSEERECRRDCVAGYGTAGWRRLRSVARKGECRRSERCDV